MSKIILMQYDKAISSRTFISFTNESELIKNIFSLAKAQTGMKGILTSHPLSPILNDLEAVTLFVYSLYDFGYYENVKGRYAPYGKAGFINRLVEFLDHNASST